MDNYSIIKTTVLPIADNINQKEEVMYTDEALYCGGYLVKGFIPPHPENATDVLEKQILAEKKATIANLDQNDRRCHGITKKGARCKNKGMRLDGNEWYCWDHHIPAEKKSEETATKVTTGEKQKFIVAGTGSRGLQSVPVEDKIVAKEVVIKELTRLKEKYDLTVMSGMAEGFDKLLALCAIELDIPLVAVIPNKGYGNYYWGRNSLTGSNMMAQFNDILSKAVKVIYVMEDIYKTSSIYGPGGKHSNFIRNEHMVNECDGLLVWDPSSRGTAQCLTYAKKVGKPYIILT